jgi:ubiquinone/menaquinone biosynthesis C-methylase UbiE
MTDAIVQRGRRYILDGSDEDLRRLLTVSQHHAETARRAFSSVGIREGWKVIDCGCGPIGGLAVMAEMVGPAGRVVGADFSEPTIQRARSIVAALGLENVELVTADINDLETTRLAGPFDLAFTRCVLMHQADPARSLSQIAALLRPGGWIIAQEPLRSPPPRSHPHLGALETYWNLLHDLIELAGVPCHAVEGLTQSARTAGLEVVEASGHFIVFDPELGFEIHAGTLAAARERATRMGAATDKIDDVVLSLRAAKAGAYQWVTSPFLLELALRKPTAA